MRQVITELRRDRWLLATAVVAGAGFAFLAAIPAVLIPNPLFQRMVPVQWWEVALWAVATPLIGIAFALSRRPVCSAQGRTFVGGIATFLAVACPTCNAPIVVAIGTAGALTYFAPIQPVIGIAGLTLLLVVIRYQAGRLGSASPQLDGTGAASEDVGGLQVSVNDGAGRRET